MINKKLQFALLGPLSLLMLMQLFFAPIALADANEGIASDCQPVSGLAIPNPCENYDCEKLNLSKSDCIKLNPIIQWVQFFINLITAIIGVGAVIMIIVAGLQYTAARDNPQAIQAARQKMVNVLIGIAAFIFLYSFIQWLIPGGVF